jgi:hypothetical protein
MIQLRWLVKEVSTRKELRPGSYGGAGTKIVKVLQYRDTILKEYHIGYLKSVWSDWKDVPEEKE